MPAPRYTNRDLARFQRKPLGIRVEEDPRAVATPDFTDEPSADQLLAEARGSLGRADTLGRENDTRSLLSIPGRLASLSLRDQRPSLLRQGTDVLDTAAGVTGLAALPTALVPGAQPLAAGLATLGGALGLPGAARRMIAPDEDESRLGGAAQAALTSLGFGPVRSAIGRSARSLFGLKGAAAPTTALARRPPLGEIVEDIPPQGGPFAQSPSSLGTPAQLGPASPNRLLPPAGSIQAPPPPAVRGLLGAGTPEPPVPSGPVAPATWAGARSRMADRLAGKRPRGRGPRRESTLAPEVATADDNPYAMDIDAILAGADEPDLQVLDPLTSSVNASGESAASVEAMRRLVDMKRAGEEFVVRDPGGNFRKLILAEGVDYNPRPGETFGVMTPRGFQPRSRGERTFRRE